ncbi:MAG: LTA synthase family protein [Planctomycetota bacterium]|jgi:phosphoglycerol transferase MdoB-like AlkP superfamily enzyme
MRRIALHLVLFGLLVALFSVLRVVFWAAFSGADEPAGAAAIGRAFYVGFKFDVRLALLLLLPFVALSRIPRLDPFREDGARRFWAAFWSVLLLVVLFQYIVDFAHYSWLRRRLHAATAEDMQNPIMSLKVIWSSYPVGWALIGLAGLGTGLYFGFRALLRRIVAREAAPVARRTRVAVTALFCGLYVFGLYGKLSFYPLRWSDAFFTSHRFAANLALNPVLFLADTIGAAEGEEFDPDKAREHYGRMAHYLGVEKPDKEALDYRRSVQPTPLLAKDRPNIIVISLESLANHLTGFFGNELDPSPNFDALVAKSIVYDKFFTPRAGTARGLFATITGTPDTSTHVTASRNPRLVDQYVMLDKFAGYEKFYFIGGSANWANVRGLLKGNIAGLQIYEEGMYEAPRIDVWGISDLALLTEAHGVLEKTKQPFFAMLICSGNHKPYSIPENRGDFELKDADPAALARNGFESLGQYNSFRFMDYALGEYMKRASKSEYFKNTIFMLLGDNGAAGRGPTMSAVEERLGLQFFHTPLVIHAPGADLGGEVRSVPGSQYDLVPTAAGAAGLALENRTLGRNLLDKRYDDRRLAFMEIPIGAGMHSVVVGEEYCLHVHPAGGDAPLYRFAASRLDDLSAQQPADAQRLKEMATGIFHTARYMLYNNAPGGR